MPETAKPRVAVIGLGSMGFGMAASLRRAGFDVTGCEVSREIVARYVADGGKAARTPAEAAEDADVVVSVVLNAAQTEAILFGKDGVAETLAGDAVVVSCATMDPDGAAPRQKKATGGPYLDAPIRGGAQGAARATDHPGLGQPDAFARARPVLDAIAAKVYELGDARASAPSSRWSTNCSPGDIAAAREAIAFAAKLGLDLQKVYRGHHRLRRQFLDVRKLGAACARWRLQARGARSRYS